MTLALDAPWDALVVTLPARDIPSLAAMERRLPERPRVLLTNDQLHEALVFWGMGDNPFKWSPRSEEQDRDREKAFSNWLRSNDPDVPWDRVADALLDRHLGTGGVRDPRSTGGGSASESEGQE